MGNSITTIEESIEEMLEKDGWCTANVKGVSMFPMLRNGVDQVLVRKPSERLKRYDVVVYRAPQKYILHRVLEVHPDHYVIRGDNCVSKEYVRNSQIVGFMAGFWRGDRFIEATDPRYLRYAHFWVAINPLVRLWHMPHVLASKIFHLIFGPDVHPFSHSEEK